MENIKISKYVTLLELLKSQTAVRLGIRNVPNENEIENLKIVCIEVFDKVREHFDVPIFISSGYRCEKLNKSIGGSDTSQHMKGQALDIDADIYGKITNKEIFEYVKNNLEFDQLIWEFGDEKNPAWVHVSFVKGNNRKQILRIDKNIKKIII